MLIAGVLLSASAVASLARHLQGLGQVDLAQELGFAVDANRGELRLAPSEEDAILSVLHDCPVVLQPLRDALEANVHRRGEGLA